NKLHPKRPTKEEQSQYAAQSGDEFTSDRRLAQHLAVVRENSRIKYQPQSSCGSKRRSKTSRDFPFFLADDPDHQHKPKKRQQVRFGGRKNQRSSSEKWTAWFEPQKQHYAQQEQNSHLSRY